MISFESAQITRAFISILNKSQKSGKSDIQNDLLQFKDNQKAFKTFHSLHSLTYTHTQNQQAKKSNKKKMFNSAKHSVRPTTKRGKKKKNALAHLITCLKST